MENILIFDTSFASLNKGDDIIMECVRSELAPLLYNNFELNLPTHTPAFNWLQVLKTSFIYKEFANTKYKFVGGSNLLVSNMLTHYPQWNVNFFNAKPIKESILIGVGAGADIENGTNWYTTKLYKYILNEHFFHSVRDERTKQYLQSINKPVINTGCVTMWALTPEFCKMIPCEKSDNVVFTLSASSYIDDRDQILINILNRNYKSIYFWPQGHKDLEYLHRFKNISNIKVIQATKHAYDTFLNNNEVDYIGTRLHGGIYALRHKRRSIIISFDERAKSISDDVNIFTIQKNELNRLEDVINSEIITDIHMPIEQINNWKSQFII